MRYLEALGGALSAVGEFHYVQTVGPVGHGKRQCILAVQRSSVYRLTQCVHNTNAAAGVLTKGNNSGLVGGVGGKKLVVGGLGRTSAMREETLDNRFPQALKGLLRVCGVLAKRLSSIPLGEIRGVIFQTKPHTHVRLKAVPS